MNTVSHALDRRRSRNKSYYICSSCNNQFLFARPKDRVCPVCFTEKLKFVQTVDEFTESMITEYSEGTILIGDSEEFLQKCHMYSNWLLANAYKEYIKEKAEMLISNIVANSRKESY